jgi:hypothetical protein
MEISDPKLNKLDKRVGEFYKLAARYLNHLSNTYGRKIYKNELSIILKEANNIRPKSEFDKLILRNIQSNLRLNDLTIDYFSDPKFPLSVKEFFDKMAGKGAWSHLETILKSPPWKEIWEYGELIQERNYSQVNRFTEEAQKAAKSWLPKIKDNILKHGKAEGYLPDDFDMVVLLLPPKDEGECSYWNSKTKNFCLGSYGFEFYLKNKDIIAKPAQAYKAAFHEVLGHAANQVNSEQLPYSIKFTEEIGHITPTKSVTEGIAINNEKLSFNFLKNNLENLKLAETDIQLLEKETDLADFEKYASLFYHLIKDRELREEGFNGYEYLLKLTQNPITARNFKNRFKGEFSDAWRNIGHTLGPLHYKQMLDRVEQEFGKNYLEKNKSLFNKCALRGVWSWEVYPDAVAYFLREESKQKS